MCSHLLQKGCVPSCPSSPFLLWQSVFADLYDNHPQSPKLCSSVSRHLLYACIYNNKVLHIPFQHWGNLHQNHTRTHILLNLIRIFFRLRRRNFFHLSFCTEPFLRGNPQLNQPNCLCQHCLCSSQSTRVQQFMSIVLLFPLLLLLPVSLTHPPIYENISEIICVVSSFYSPLHSLLFALLP